MQYIVIRRRDIYGYLEHLGPMVSTPTSVEQDAKRLYGKPGYSVRWVALSRATESQKRLAEQNPNNKSNSD